MTASLELSSYHKSQAAKATEIYVQGLTTPRAADDWYLAHAEARLMVVDTLRATNCLRDVSAGLLISGAHSAVLRQLLAPPFSQDQFALLCPDYPKRAEKTGRGLAPVSAKAVEEAFHAGRDRRLTRWLTGSDGPTFSQVRNLLRSVVPVLSMQLAATNRRNRMSVEQEGAVTTLLVTRGWLQKSSPLISSLSDVPAKHFMHKTRFATQTRPQEVDVACGLGATVVLAMECKVTNDETNSVKRINDILKKATAWQLHWGSFVRTAALLQGVIAFKDVERLLDANVDVFWSHDLPTFEAWLSSNTTGP